MLNPIIGTLRMQLLTRAPLDATPEGVWKRTGALNTWGTNAIEGNTLSWADVEKLLLEGAFVEARHHLSSFHPGAVVDDPDELQGAHRRVRDRDRRRG